MKTKKQLETLLHGIKSMKVNAVKSGNREMYTDLRWLEQVVNYILDNDSHISKWLDSLMEVVKPHINDDKSKGIQLNRIEMDFHHEN